MYLGYLRTKAAQIQYSLTGLYWFKMENHTNSLVLTLQMIDRY